LRPAAAARIVVVAAAARVGCRSPPVWSGVRADTVYSLASGRPQTNALGSVVFGITLSRAARLIAIFAAAISGSSRFEIGGQQQTSGIESQHAATAAVPTFAAKIARDVCTAIKRDAYDLQPFARPIVGVN